MRMKTVVALAAGAALALPFSALAEDKPASGVSTGASAVIVGGSASAGASGGALAPRTQEGREANSAAYKHLDTNNDSHVSMAEMRGSGYERQFASLDKNRDGLLMYQEFSELNVGSASVGSGAGGTNGGASSGAGTPAPRY